MSKQKKALKYAKQTAQAQQQIARSQSLASSAQWRASQAQQQYWAQQQAWQNQMARQQWEAQQAENYRRWAAAQPLVCSHCHQSSAPGSETCANCGSRQIAIAQPQASRPTVPAPRPQGLRGFAAKAAQDLGYRR